MSKQIEALKLALECVEAWDRGCDRDLYWRDIEAAITAIREALAEQPAQQQEPVAWMKPHPKCDSACLFQCTKGFTQFPECATPQPSKPWVPLTEFDIDQIPYSCSHADSRLIAFAIEAKLREKNAQPSKPLTDEQIEQCMKQAYATVQGRNLEHAFARAIEAAHQIGVEK